MLVDRHPRKPTRLTAEKGKNLVASLGGSEAVPACTPPVELGTNVSGSRDDKGTGDYDIVTGIVHAYRLFTCDSARKYR